MVFDYGGGQASAEVILFDKALFHGSLGGEQFLSGGEGT